MAFPYSDPKDGYIAMPSEFIDTLSTVMFSYYLNNEEGMIMEEDRAFFFFDTSGVSGAIASALLKFKVSEVFGTMVHQVHICSGCFGDSLDLADWDISMNLISELNINSTGWKGVPVGASGINKGGWTDFRLRVKTPLPPNVELGCSIYSGNAIEANRAQLILSMAGGETQRIEGVSLGEF
ncbi:MAG: hypothetical protein QME66_04670 [Candidatus Eisenbacteria bacterium]|nr:hypothetical protein [Candidatus Eisenbacteria bacterium]